MMGMEGTGKVCIYLFLNDNVYRGRPPSGVKLQDSPSSFLPCGWNDPATKSYDWGLTAVVDRKECPPKANEMELS